MVTYVDSEWGYEQFTLTDPPVSFDDSEWGFAQFTLTDPDGNPRVDSAWGVAQFTLTDPPAPHAPVGFMHNGVVVWVPIQFMKDGELV